MTTQKRYTDLKKKAINNVGGPTAWTNFNRRIHVALVADQILTWQMSQDDSLDSARLRARVEELWGAMNDDEEL